MGPRTLSLSSAAARRSGASTRAMTLSGACSATRCWARPCASSPPRPARPTPPTAPMEPTLGDGLQLREVAALPDPNVRPPTLAESGDPFAALRVAHLLARIPRGVPVRLRDVVDRLNA